MQGFFAAAFLYNPETDCVLLQKRDMKAPTNPGLWSFFGGSSEAGEVPIQTLIRELKEELDIYISAEDVKPLTDYRNEKLQRQSYIFIIESTLDKSQMTLSEGEDFDWIPFKKALELKLAPSTKKCLEVLRERVNAKQK